MTIRDRFESQPWASALAYRKDTFGLMIEHFEKAAAIGLNQIIETGTARMRGNWSGDGQSTLIWDWLAGEIDGAKVLSIDLNPAAVDVAKEQTKNVKFLVGDSIEKLSGQKATVLSKVGLLYLDSLDFEWGRGQVSAQHHLGELLAVWENLPSGCLIAVDDCHSPYQGKHVAVAHFMADKQIAPAFSGYQMGWIKP